MDWPRKGPSSVQGDHRLQEQAWNLLLILRHARLLLPVVCWVELNRETGRKEYGR